MHLGRLIANALAFHQAYGNPLELCYHRLFNPKGDCRIVDRATKIEVRAKVAAYPMFGEIWRDHDYDIPRVPIRPGDVVIDIGGNHGFYSCYAAHLGARVLAFEPVSSLFQCLEKNVKKNGFSDRVTARCCGVSDRPGQVEMTLLNWLGGGMNTIVDEFAEKMPIEVTGKIQVEMTTFASILVENKVDHVRICKIDCEGAELMILRTITADMAAKIDAFVIEYHPVVCDPRDIMRHILGWGTHQASYAADKYCERTIIRAVRTSLLTD